MGIIPAYAGSTRYSTRCSRDGRDHPRVCGEHRPRRALVAGCAGSSPRMRGAQRRLAALSASVGIIPAYAGSTLTHPALIHAAQDHPRVCGEHRRIRQVPLVKGGSSPRMRGARRTTPRTLATIWIIPAYAGSTRTSAYLAERRRDHPRVCGEHLAPVLSGAGSLGSSPRMRGAHPHGPESAVHVGIIPAYAGSTTGHPHGHGSHEDHPRVCGEHCPPLFSHRITMGSSPRMRGARYEQPRHGGDGRDHPRVCGEHAQIDEMRPKALGSSPRMRGALGCDVVAVKLLGIIPAYAGSTTRWRRRSGTREDHPRVCGEHSCSAAPG